jgi:hypothetical protein
MGDLENAWMKLYGDPSTDPGYVGDPFSKETQGIITGQNPYPGFQEIPGAISKSIIAGASKDPTSDNIRDSAVTGLVGGLLTGMFGNMGRNYQTEQTEQYQDVLRGRSDGSDLSPALQLKAQQAQDLFDSARKQNLMEMLMEVEQHGDKKSAELAAINQDMKDHPYKYYSAAEKANAQQAGVVTDELKRLANEFKGLDKNFVEIFPDRYLSSTAGGKLFAKINLLLVPVVRLGGEVGNNAEKEQARALFGMMGNLDAGSEDIATMLDNAADLYLRLSKGRQHRANLGLAGVDLETPFSSLEEVDNYLGINPATGKVWKKGEKPTTPTREDGLS